MLFCWPVRFAWGPPARRKIIVDEDCSGPGVSNLQTVAMLLQAREVEVLGRLLQERYGKVAYTGAWDERWWHEPFVIPALAEGKPKLKPAEEYAPRFLLRMVRKYPGEVTIYEGGPMTNLVQAISIDAGFRNSARTDVYGRQPESEQRLRGICQQSAARIQFLVRPRSRNDCDAGAMEENWMHACGYFDQDSAHAGDGCAYRRGLERLWHIMLRDIFSRATNPTTDGLRPTFQAFPAAAPSQSSTNRLE